jgi:hypothetical protein
MKGFRLKAKSSTVDAIEQKGNETPLEAQTRQDGNFAEIESILPKRFGWTEMGLIDRGTGMS